MSIKKYKSKSNQLIITLLGVYGLISPLIQAQTSVEEARIKKAESSIPKSVQLLDRHHQKFIDAWSKQTTFVAAKRLIDETGDLLWQDAKLQIHQLSNYDDRSLYWQRLKLSKIIRNIKPRFSINEQQKIALLERLEQSSRGILDLNYQKKTDKRILLTGFDPFLLDRHINQSNPSGVAAIMLDGMVIEHQGITAEINTFTVPVRYSDFDQGFIEQTLSPFYALNSVDLITTVSMGRKNFDLERFPGKRRSAEAPGNLNVFSGGSKTKPVISKLFNRPLPGPEFVEFSLPVKSMMQAKGQFKINDNHQVTTLNKTFEPQSLNELTNETAVAGSGGGYLSNEISYRSIRLKNELNSIIPTGHIHTPRIQQFDAKTSQMIVEQIVEMLKLSLADKP